jgi:hypothetical protein
MTEETRSDSSIDEGQSGATGDAAAQGFGSVEEAIAFHRNRQSGIDKAHAAETAELRRQLDEARKPPPSVPPEGESAETARLRQLEAELAAEKAARQAVTLQAQFPYASSVLGEEITRLSPEKVAALEATYQEAGTVRPINDNNAAPRRSTAVQAADQRAYNEKSKEELLADLRRATPAFQEAVREGY